MIMTIDVRMLAFRAATAAVMTAVLVEATVVALLLESLRRYGLFETPESEGEISKP
jgi:hypothetical protein